MAGAKQIGANVFAAPEEIAGGFSLLGRNVDRDHAPEAARVRRHYNR
jgi:hypothetical protein